MSEVKFLGDGTAVLVIGPAPDYTNDLDGTTHPQLLVARLTTEEIEEASVFDAAPATTEEIAAAATEKANPDAHSEIGDLEARGVLTPEEAAAARARL